MRDNGLGWSIAGAVWWFAYFWVGLALTGRTVGKGVLGLRVVTSEGGPLTQGRALARVLVFPLSFLLLGLGLWMALPDRRDRTLHDRVAGTSEVYDWRDRPAERLAPLSHWLTSRGVDLGQTTST